MLFLLRLSNHLPCFTPSGDATLILQIAQDIKYKERDFVETRNHHHTGTSHKTTCVK
ncbi:hypothetical protein M419DRAFT_124792 [Trichoderma reesei RUT C-30]|uniref:Uncharacterized protein n=1 Tax=Hypocrea jecorina (strain ATCC 56765 / BCRC 32924 / NRRL 11460 / Rut C-30) TaxID=1344414 RepID=A0A024RZD7_HYPJR|nr:hypothetical protein M419DRAFT_124792 [Trichoderma reesei RUT C-30]